MTPQQSPQSSVKKWRVSRRGFLIGLGATVAAVAVGVPIGLPRARLAIANFIAEGGSFGGVDAPPTSWFEITADNRIRFFNPKVEMGQGIHTSLAQVAAEQCRRLVAGGVAEFHFYTMNRSELSLATCRALGIKPNETVAPSAPTDRTIA